MRKHTKMKDQVNKYLSRRTKTMVSVHYQSLVPLIDYVSAIFQISSRIMLKIDPLNNLCSSYEPDKPRAI